MIDENGRTFAIAKYALGLGVAYAAAGAAFTIFTGLAAIAAAVVAGFVAGQAWPIAQIKIVRQIATWFPIETLISDEQRQTKELAEAREEVVEARTGISGFRREVDDLGRQLGEDDEAVQEQRKLLEQMIEVTDFRAEKADEAEKALKDFRGMIARMEAILRVSKAGRRLAKRTMLSQASFADLKRKTAYNTIRSSMDRAFAQLAESKRQAEAGRVAIQGKEAPALTTGAPRLEIGSAPVAVPVGRGRS